MQIEGVMPFPGFSSVACLSLIELCFKRLVDGPEKQELALLPHLNAMHALHVMGYSNMHPCSSFNLSELTLDGNEHKQNSIEEEN